MRHTYINANNVITKLLNGGLAQMVERMVRIHEAQGSIPWFSNYLVTLTVF